jgi:hypothetical protein
MLAVANGAPASGQKPSGWAGVLDDHPVIQYAVRPTTDRVAKLGEALARTGRAFERDPRTGYLLPILDALDIPVESQLLVFSRTGVQGAYTSPRNPRALYFDDSVVVGYIPGAPVIEIAAHDPQQGVIFYTVDQSAAAPVFTRRTSCLTCHVAAGTLTVPGMIVRSHTVGEGGNVMRQFGVNSVDHRTPHPDRWGGWFVTAIGGPARYAQRAHAGNITTSAGGVTSNQAFIDWLDSEPEAHGYPSASSDIVALMAFDHEMHAINLLTRLNWEWRVAASDRGLTAPDRELDPLIDELADYLLFVGEAPPSVPLTPRPGFAAHLESKVPKDARGRSFGQLDLVTRLLRYPCSYLVYSEAFDGLAPPVKQALYRRIIGRLSDEGPRAVSASAGDRRAVLEILRDTKPDFPRLSDHVSAQARQR